MAYESLLARTPKRLPEGVFHGTRLAYKNHVCRCEDCTLANSVWQLEYRRARKPGAARANREEQRKRRAMRRLAKLHPEEFERLLEYERRLDKKKGQR